MLGGRYNGLNMEVSGLPILAPSTNALFFLDHDHIVGFGQGLFQITPQAISRFPNSGLPSQSFSSDMLPNEREAQSCLAPIIDSHYADGWHLKHMYTHHTTPDVNNVFPFSTYEGIEYKVITCTDGKPESSTLMLEDRKGDIVVEKNSRSKELSLDFIANETSYYHIQFGVGPSIQKSISSGIAIGILYRE